MIATPVTWDRLRAFFRRGGHKAKSEHFHAEAELVNIMAIFSIRSSHSLVHGNGHTRLLLPARASLRGSLTSLLIRFPPHCDTASARPFIAFPRSLLPDYNHRAQMPRHSYTLITLYCSGVRARHAARASLTYYRELRKGLYHSAETIITRAKYGIKNHVYPAVFSVLRIMHEKN